MDDSATKDKKDKRPDTAVSKDNERESRGRDSKPENRARSRSIWGRSKKEKPPAMPA